MKQLGSRLVLSLRPKNCNGLSGSGLSASSEDLLLSHHRKELWRWTDWELICSNEGVPPVFSGEEKALYFHGVIHQNFGLLSAQIFTEEVLSLCWTREKEVPADRRWVSSVRFNISTNLENIKII